MDKTELELVSQYQLIDPKTEKETFGALGQIKNTIPCWQPPIASRCINFIEQIKNSSLVLPEDHEQIESYIIGKFRPLTEVKFFKENPEDYKKKFSIAMNSTIFTLERFFR